MRRSAFLFPLLALILGCSRTGSPRIANKAPTGPVDPWKLVCTDPHATTPALLWNGLIGVRIGRDGSPAGQPMFDIDQYETTGEEKIKTLQCPLKMRAKFDADRVTDYSQVLDMKTGMLTTRWMLDGQANNVSLVLHPDAKLIAERWTYAVQISGANPPPLTKASEEVEEVESTGRNEILKAIGKPAEPAAPKKPLPKFDAVAKAAADYWARAWQTDIEIDGPPEDQQAVRSFLFYLRSAIHPNGLMAISPFGLSNSKYNGHVFWDADIWVFPALALIDPEKAKVIPEYRLSRLKAAHDNFDEWLKIGRPTAATPLGARSLIGSGGRAKFPWESSVSGHETTPGPSRFEDHITGSVAFGLEQAWRLGLADDIEVDKARKASALFYTMRSSEEQAGESRILGTVSPDENHIGDNDLYTNVLAEQLLNALRHGPEPFRFKRPHDDKSLLTYDNDGLKSYKQAAAVLAIYPLQDLEAEKEAKVMMDRFADKVIKNGPAMSDSLHALIWARIGEPDKGYDVWKKSWQDFTNHPLMLFSEKRNKDDTYFTTGAAGCLQSVIYGFLGFRIDSKQDPKAPWSKELRAGRYLSVKPNLPKAWKSVKFKNFSVLGTRYTLIATHQGVQVIPGDK